MQRRKRRRRGRRRRKRSQEEDKKKGEEKEKKEEEKREKKKEKKEKTFLWTGGWADGRKSKVVQEDPGDLKTPFSKVFIWLEKPHSETS